MAQVINPGAMTDEELEALHGPGAQNQQPNEPTEPPTAAPEPTVEPPQRYEIDGEELSIDDIRALKASGMRQEDYTKKTQELAQQREQVGNLATIMQAWETRPDLRPMILSELAKEAGMELPGQGQGQPQGTPEATQVQGLMGTYDPRDSTPEWEQRGYESPGEMRAEQRALSAEQRAINAEKAAIAMSQKFEGYLGQQSQTQQQNLAAQTAAAEIATKFNLKGVTGELVLDAMTSTGINDPEAAFLKAHAARILSGAQAPAKPAEKPVTPSPDGTGRTFDPMDPKLSAGQTMLLLEQGYIPLES